MDEYDAKVAEELTRWRRKMTQPPSFFNEMSRKSQAKINSFIPEKIHVVITAAIKQMIRAVIFGADYTTSKPHPFNSFEERENKIEERIRFYRNTAATEGAITGAGGILLGLADFPLWLTLKMKLLFEIAALYGIDTKDYKERVFILYIFQLTFTSQQVRNKVFSVIENWEHEKNTLPDDINSFDWRSFQQGYRDYIDLAKLFQLIPGVGAFVGAFVNHKLTSRLGKTAMNSYRLRILPGI